MGNKQQLQLNNETLGSILSNVLGLPSQESLKHGAYVWKKLTAQGGDFVDFVVSDSESAYPDGGEQGGYWYEKVKEGFDPTLFGYTKYAIDKITFTNDTSTASVDINHSLGEEPKEVMIYVVNPENITNNSQIISFHASSGVSGDAAVAVFKRYYSYADSKRSYITNNASLTKHADKITVGTTTSYKFKGGEEYTVITMA